MWLRSSAYELKLTSGTVWNLRCTTMSFLPAKPVHQCGKGKPPRQLSALSTKFT